MRLSLQLLNGLSTKTRYELEKAGITSLNQIAEMKPDDLRRIKGIKTTAPSLHAQARAYVEKNPIWTQPLPDACQTCGWMFDIETDPFQDFTHAWSIGWCDTAGNSKVAIVAPTVDTPQPLTLPNEQEIILVPDHLAAWEVFADHVGENDRHVHHWTGYDSGVMRNSAPENVIERLNPRLHDLHATVKRTVQFPVKGTSIKTIAAYLNYRYGGYEAWDAAFYDYQAWLRTGDINALTRACTYQIDDVEAMRVVWSWMMAQTSSAG